MGRNSLQTKGFAECLNIFPRRINVCEYLNPQTQQILTGAFTGHILSRSYVKDMLERIYRENRFSILGIFSLITYATEGFPIWKKLRRL